MTDNFPVNRSVINYIHARDYFPSHEIDELRPLLDDVNWIDNKFGKEMENFNIIFQDIDIILGKMVGDLVEIDKKNSGTLIKPYYEIIHFEDFKDLNDWRFIVALDKNEFKTYTHKSGYKSMIDYVKDTAEEKTNLDFTDVDQWEEESIIKMNPNDVLFYRPWIFHSFQDGILHYYKLKVI